MHNCIWDNFQVIIGQVQLRYRFWNDATSENRCGKIYEANFSEVDDFLAKFVITALKNVLKFCYSNHDNMIPQCCNWIGEEFKHFETDAPADPKGNEVYVIV